MFLWQSFSSGSAGRESACSAGYLGLIPGLGRSPGEENSYLLQYSGLENSMDCIESDTTEQRSLSLMAKGKTKQNTMGRGNFWMWWLSLWLWEWWWFHNVYLFPNTSSCNILNIYCFLYVNHPSIKWFKKF